MGLLHLCEKALPIPEWDSAVQHMLQLPLHHCQGSTPGQGEGCHSSCFAGKMHGGPDCEVWHAALNLTPSLNPKTHSTAYE